MSGPAVRRMRPDEAGSVRDLLLRANREHLETFPPDVAAAYLDELADVSGRMTTSHVFVSVAADGEVVGTATLLTDAALDAHPWPANGAVLRFVAVDPRQRGTGRGSELTRFCISEARASGAAFLGLHTAPTMVSARAMYERLGFRRTPEHDFDPGEHYGSAPASSDTWGLAYVLDLR